MIALQTSTSPTQQGTTSKIWLASGLCLIVGLVGGAAAYSAWLGWFPALIKPLWSPSGAALLACTLLFHLLWGVAMGVHWSRGLASRSERIALGWYGGVLGLNLLWTLAFFTLRSPSWGYTLAIVVWLAILATMWTSTKYIGLAGWLLLPCLGWATFASTLNFHVLTLNIIKPKVEAMDKDPANQRKRFYVPRQKPEIKPETLRANSTPSP